MLKQVWGALRDEQATALARLLLRWAAGVALVIFALGLYAPGLGNTRFVFGTDTVSHDYIMHYYAWVQSISGKGEIPLWNPYMFSGMPMIGSASICPFYPSQWLYAILPFNTAFTLQYVLALAVGGIGAGWWMRCLNHRRAVCVWAGALYMVSGHFLTLTHAGHLQKMIALGWVPVALGATIQIMKTGGSEQRRSDRFRAACLLGIALGMQLLATHPQVFYATALACVVQLIGLALYSVPWKAVILGQSTTNGSTPGAAFTRIGRAAVMSLLALAVCVALSAVQLFPTIEMSALSNRAEGVSFEEATQTSYPPLELFEYAIPALFGSSVRDYPTVYFGKWGERIVTDYVGLPVLILALIGLLGSRRKYRWFLLTLFLTGVIVGLGRYTPVYWLLWKVLPGFDGFRSPGTFMFLSNCGLVGLSALGLDYLLNLADSVNNRGWGSALSTSADDIIEDEADESKASVSPVRTTESYGAGETQPLNVEELAREAAENDYSQYMGTDTPPQGMPTVSEPDYDELEADPGFGYSYPESLQSRASSNFTWDSESLPWLGRAGVLVFLAAVAIASMAAAIIALAENWGVDLKIATDAERMSYHTHSRVAITAVALMLLLASIILLRVRTWIGGVAIGVTALSFPLVHNLEYLKFDPLAPYMAHLTRQGDLQALAANGSRPIRLLEENALKNESMLYGISSVAGYHPIQSKVYGQMAEALGYGSSGFGSLFGVNHVRSRNAVPPVDGEWRIAEEFPDGAGGSKIWLRNQPFPWAREKASLDIMGDSDDSEIMQVARHIQETVSTVGDQQYYARISLADAQRFRLVEGIQQVTAQLQLWSPHEVRLRVNGTPSREGARVLLPVSDPYWPGWKAETSRARPLPVIPVNAVQRGVALPSGEQNIRFIYRPYSFKLGLFVSLFSVTVLLFYGLGTVTRRLTRGQRKIRKVIQRVQTGQQPVLDTSSQKDPV